MSESAAPHDFQYADTQHQAQTAIAGMWLFLATEVLFFGGLILAWIYCRHWNQAGFDAGARATELWIGTLNTFILVTSSFAYATGLAFIRVGSTRGLIRCCLVTAALGLTFLGLKFGLEWHDDFANHVFPNISDFKIKGPEQGGARLFFVFYFISTGLHGLHLVGGIGLVTWIILRARRGEFTPQYHTPVHVVGLYWSFVDIVWLTLYPLIYLIGRG
ncbi:MAG TPA: cytochrome c oxidase subunit 3 [Acetobacteraceae bacterium]|nr:cytochrome c oxidase subunit 3 [Acetobacteraceae bacterium]